MCSSLITHDYIFYSVQIKKLDDTEFRNAFSHGYVRVC